MSCVGRSSNSKGSWVIMELVLEPLFLMLVNAGPEGAEARPTE